MDDILKGLKSAMEANRRMLEKELAKIPSEKRQAVLNIKETDPLKLVEKIKKILE
jgi:hypothetical protein